MCTGNGSIAGRFSRAAQKKIPATPSGGQKAGHACSNQRIARAIPRVRLSRRNGGR